MSTEQAEPIPFDSQVARVLRQAARAAGQAQLDVEHIEAALDHPDADEPPPVRARMTPRLRDFIQRARQLALESDRASVTLGDLREALVEGRAIAAELDLNRLRFARTLAPRASGPAPALRQYPARADVEVTAG